MTSARLLKVLKVLRTHTNACNSQCKGFRCYSFEVMREDKHTWLFSLNMAWIGKKNYVTSYTMITLNSDLCHRINGGNVISAR